MKKIAIFVVLVLFIGFFSLSVQAERIVPIYIENYEIGEGLDNNFYPVYRTVDGSRPIGSSIEKILNIDIDIYESAIGFESEWSADHEVELIGVSLKNELLKIELNDPDRFTSGGSMRVRSLRTQIEKSVLEFKKVNRVEFVGPEHLFQP